MTDTYRLERWNNETVVRFNAGKMTTLGKKGLPDAEQLVWFWDFCQLPELHRQFSNARWFCSLQQFYWWVSDSFNYLGFCVFFCLSICTVEVESWPGRKSGLGCEHPVMASLFKCLRAVTNGGGPYAVQGVCKRLSFWSMQHSQGTLLPPPTTQTKQTCHQCVSLQGVGVYTYKVILCMCFALSCFKLLW